MAYRTARAALALILNRLDRIKARRAARNQPARYHGGEDGQ